MLLASTSSLKVIDTCITPIRRIAVTAAQPSKDVVLCDQTGLIMVSSLEELLSTDKKLSNGT